MMRRTKILLAIIVLATIAFTGDILVHTDLMRSGYDADENGQIEQRSYRIVPWASRP